MSAIIWQCRVSTNLQFVKNASATKSNKAKHNKTKSACLRCSGLNWERQQPTAPHTQEVTLSDAIAPFLTGRPGEEHPTSFTVTEETLRNTGGFGEFQILILTRFSKECLCRNETCLSLGVWNILETLPMFRGQFILLLFKERCSLFS